jgi:hypothetical protein
MINFNKIAVSEKVLFPAEWSSITSESFQDGKLLCAMGFVLRSKKKNNENGFSTAFATGSLGPKVQLFNLDQSPNFFFVSKHVFRWSYRQFHKLSA